MKCPSSVFVHHSIKFCQSHWLWSCAKLVCSGCSKYSSKTISIFSFFLAWKHSWCDFPPLIWQAQKWQGAPSSLHCTALPPGSAVFAGRRWAQWGNPTWKPCLALTTRTRLAELGLCAGSSPTSPPPAPCYPRTAFAAAVELHLPTAVFWPDSGNMLLWERPFPIFPAIRNPQAALAATSTPVRRCLYFLVTFICLTGQTRQTFVMPCLFCGFPWSILNSSLLRISLR